MQEHAYTKEGSHLVTLEALAPGDTSYIVLDTVQVSIVPQSGYKLPTVAVAAQRDSFASQKPLTFISQARVDPSVQPAAYLWDFGDGSTSTAASPQHTYADSDFSHFVYVQLTDSYGLKATNGISVTGDRSKISLTPLIVTASAVPLVDVPQAPKRSATSNSLIIGLAFLVILLPIMSFFIFEED